MIPINEVLKNRHWFYYIFNETNPEASRFKCKLCSKYQDVVKYLDFSELASDSGTLKKTLKGNRNLLQNHGKSKSHLRLIEDIQKYHLENFVSDVQIGMKTMHENPKFKVTNQVMRAVYTQAKHHISLNTHPAIMKLLENVGFEVEPHCLAPYAAKNMILSIGTSMRKKMVQSFSKPTPLALIADTSDDFAKKKQLSVLISSLESDLPISMYLRIICIRAAVFD